MSFNNINYHQKSCINPTFQGNLHFARPPPPAQYMFPPPRQPVTTDEGFIKQFEKTIPTVEPKKVINTVSISQVHDQIRDLVLALNKLKSEQKILTDQITDLSDDEWNSHLKCVEENKSLIGKILANINNLNTDVLRKLLAKRASKRVRQKRQRAERRKEKEDLKREREEKSRKIDEFLQKYQDDMNKAKQEEEAKLQADFVLKETIRKKQDAKKYIAKFDALVKLRRARYNTAHGRGEKVSEAEARIFENNIEKLKSLWQNRLDTYNREEAQLRNTLQQSQQLATPDTEQEVAGHLAKWLQVMFGGHTPQVDFGGDLDRFVSVRSQWDMYLSNEGSSLPIGWVPPTQKT